MSTHPTSFANNGGTIKKKGWFFKSFAFEAFFAKHVRHLVLLPEDVVISLEPNGPEELKEDNIPKNEVVVLFGGNTVPGFMPIPRESMVLSSLCIEEEGSRNKRKFVSKLPLGTPTNSHVPSLAEFPRYELLEKAPKGGTLFEIDPLKGGCPQFDAEQKMETPPDIDWEDTITTQLLELLTQNISTIFQSAVKRIANCGYSEEITERVILRSGIYHGSKDVVSNVVDGALALLSREKVFDISRPVVFVELPFLVYYTLLEMVCVLREVKPALPVVEAMWWLLILDLNLVHACAMKGYHLLSKPFTPIAQNLKSKVLVASATPQEPESKNSHVCQVVKGKESSTPFPKAEAKSKAAVLEDKSGAAQKALNSKKDLHWQKTYQFEKNRRICTGKNIKANMTAWGNLDLDKKLNSSFSDATKKSSHSKVKTSVKCNQPLEKASFDSPCPSSSIAPARKYVPQNQRDETILLRTSRLETLKKELQGWFDWANEKVMQATRRLGKDKVELKLIRQEKKDAEKVHQEKQILEENTMERIMEIEQMLVNTNSMSETINSLLNTLEMDNVGLKKDMEIVMLSTCKHAMNVKNVLAKEQDAMKKCEAADTEKRSFEEDLSTIKLNKTSL
ncbi:putative E3 ubiquitin-protein ligase RF298 [Solanum tuberosum]|uniref:putative E3 ubiquitin-protein ligase RF298 n=1 Tax=Solanum tuberosum TaxID=4113 RepID=UPI00073A2726|nr:PREDICTED: putative E3 ubiquitin-protein ligase RF298 [Solanum tuberosum]